MARDEIHRESDARSSRESSSKRRRERSFDNHIMENSTYHHQSFRSLCIRKISLSFDVEYVQKQIREAFSPFDDVDVRTFKSSDRRLAIVHFRHSSGAHQAFKNKSQVYIGDRPFNVEIWDERESLMHRVAKREDSSPHCHRSSSKPSSSYHPSPFDDRSRSPIRTTSRRYGRGNRPDSTENEPLNDPKATRTLFVGSLEPDITDSEVREVFERYGVVEQVDVKHPNNSHAYAFVRFKNLDMAVQAKSKMNGNCVRSYHCKIGYGKPLISNALYISGLDNWRDAEELECFLNQFGTLIKLDWQYRQNYASAVFQSTDVAEEVNKQLKSLAAHYPDQRLMVDFIEGDLMKEVTYAPRQSSLIPLPNPFPIVPDLIPALRGAPLPFPSQLMTATFDLVRGNPEPNAALFQNCSMEDARQRRTLPRPIESSIRLAPPRRPLQTSRYGRSASPIDSFLRPDMTDLNDPVLSSITTMPDLEAFLRPHLWCASLHTKKSVFRFRCFHVVGDEALSKEISKCPSFASSDGSLRLHMPQQARTEATWMADAVEQIGKALGDPSNTSPVPFSVLLALPSLQLEKENSGEIGAVSRPLTCLVSYLRLKQRTGFLVPFSEPIPFIESEEAPKYTVLLLTPSSFSISLLKFSAPRLSSNLAFVDDFLVLLLLRN